jgi:hypothetical protein
MVLQSDFVVDSLYWHVTRRGASEVAHKADELLQDEWPPVHYRSMSLIIEQNAEITDVGHFRQAE